jgi:hypothetical protein
VIPVLHTIPGAEHKNLASGLLWGVAPDHVPGLIAALSVPLAVWPYLAWQRSAAAAGRPRAVRFVAGLEAASLPTKAAAFLLVVSASIHLALIPHRLGDGSGTAPLFLLDAAALTWLAHRAIVGRRWRGLAIWVLIANVAAYLGYLLAGSEALDEVGLTSKLVELTAIGLILVPPRRGGRMRWRRVRRWAAVGSFLSLTLLTGVAAWAAAFVEQDRVTAALAENGEPAVGHGMVGMVMQPVTWDDPNAAERRAAARLVEATRAGIAKYEDVEVALAAGYHPSGPVTLGAVIHYENSRYAHDGVTLDPTRPEALVYASTDRGILLLGAVYSLPWPLEDAPDAGGGSLTAWHSHTNACLGIAGLVGLLSPFGTCPTLSVNIATGPTMHVWTVDLPGGPFGLEPEEEDIERWLAESDESASPSG